MYLWQLYEIDKPRPLGFRPTRLSRKRMSDSLFWLRLRCQQCSVQRERRPMSEFSSQSLLNTPTVTIRDVYCRGSRRQQGAEECATATQLVFPYRGVYVRHLGSGQAVAEANQVLFFNAAEGYRVSHPVPGGDASVTVIISESQLRELAP